MLLKNICHEHRDFRIHINSPSAHKMFRDYFVKTLIILYPSSINYRCVLALTDPQVIL